MVGLGITNYFNFADRQRVRGSATEAQVFLRDIQNRAKMGDRGTGACAHSNNPNNLLNTRFNGWIVSFHGTHIQARPSCTNASGGTITGNGVFYYFPRHISIASFSNRNITFPSLYGDVTIPGNTTTITLSADNTTARFCFDVSTTGNIGVMRDENAGC
jgi:hypothetical protein